MQLLVEIVMLMGGEMLMNSMKNLGKMKPQKMHIIMNEISSVLPKNLMYKC